MKESSMHQTVFEGSYENEQIFNDMLDELHSKPSYAKQQAQTRANEKEINNRIPNLKYISKWINALRSGKYSQESRYLKGRGNYFSVLGVLCDVSRDFTGGEWHGQWFVKKGLSFRDWTKNGNSCVSVPDWALKKLGLTSRFIYLTKNKSHTFEELAAIIENEFKLGL